MASKNIDNARSTDPAYSDSYYSTPYNPPPAIQGPPEPPPYEPPSKPTKDNSSTAQWDPAKRGQPDAWFVDPSAIAFRWTSPDGEEGGFRWRWLLSNGFIPYLPDTEEDRQALIILAKVRLRQQETGETDFDSLRRDADEDPSGGGGGGGGGRGGAAGPVYVAPNRDEVEDTLKAYVVATTGTNNPEILKQATDAYMKSDRAAWDLQVSGKGGSQPSPFMDAKNVVRASAQYKTIHSLRPESVDEMDWVTGRQAKLRQLGVSDASAERLGIKQAQAGASNEALVDAAEMQFNSDTGRLLASQRQDLIGYATMAMRSA